MRGKVLCIQGSGGQESPKAACGLGTSVFLSVEDWGRVCAESSEGCGGVRGHLQLPSDLSNDLEVMRRLQNEHASSRALVFSLPYVEAHRLCFAPLVCSKGHTGHPHWWEGVGSRRVGLGAWGQPAAPAWALGTTRVISSSPNNLSRPFSKRCSASFPQISHGSWAPDQTILKDGRRAVSFSHLSLC